MSHQANHGWSGADTDECCAGMRMLSIPLPMAMFGMFVAFMFGATLGMLMGKKHGMMAGGGSYGMGWKKRRHHHHGFGMPACCEQHSEMQESTETAAK